MTGTSTGTATRVIEEAVDDDDDLSKTMKTRGSETILKSSISGRPSFVAGKKNIDDEKEKSSEENGLLEKVALAEERFWEIQKQHQEDRTKWRADRLELERLREKLERKDSAQAISADSSTNIPASTTSQQGEFQSAGNETGEKSSRPSSRPVQIGDDDIDGIEDEVHSRQVMRLAKQEEIMAHYAEEVLELRQSLHDLQIEHNLTLAKMKEQAQALARKNSNGENRYTKNLQAQLDNWQSLYYESCEQGNRKLRGLEEEIETLSRKQREQEELTRKQKKESENYFSDIKQMRAAKEKAEKALEDAEVRLEANTLEWKAQQQSPCQQESEKENWEERTAFENFETEKAKLQEERLKLEKRLEEMEEEKMKFQQAAEKREEELHERIRSASEHRRKEDCAGQQTVGTQLNGEDTLAQELCKSLELRQEELGKVIKEKEDLERQLQDLAKSFERESSRMNEELRELRNGFEKVKDEKATWEAETNDRELKYQEMQKIVARQEEEMTQLQQAVEERKAPTTTRIIEEPKAPATTRIVAKETWHSSQKAPRSRLSKKRAKEIEWQLAVLQGERDRSTLYQQHQDQLQDLYKDSSLTKQLQVEQAANKKLRSSITSFALEAEIAVEEKKQLEHKLDQITMGKTNEPELEQIPQEPKKAPSKLQASSKALARSRRIKDAENCINESHRREMEQIEGELKAINIQMDEMKSRHDKMQKDLIAQIVQEEEKVAELESTVEKLKAEHEAQIVKMKEDQRVAIQELQSALPEARSKVSKMSQRHEDELEEQRGIAEAAVLDASQKLREQNEDATTIAEEELTKGRQLELERLRSELDKAAAELLAKTEDFEREMSLEKARTAAALEDASSSKEELLQMRRERSSHCMDALDDDDDDAASSSGAAETPTGAAAGISEPELQTLRRLLDERDRSIAALEEELSGAAEEPPPKGVMTENDEHESSAVLDSILRAMQDGGDFSAAVNAYEEAAGLEEEDSAQENRINFLLSAISSSQDEIEALRLEVEAGGMFEMMAPVLLDSAAS